MSPSLDHRTCGSSVPITCAHAGDGRPPPVDTIGPGYPDADVAGVAQRLEPQPSKLVVRVRFPSPALVTRFVVDAGAVIHLASERIESRVGARAARSDAAPLAGAVDAARRPCTGREVPAGVGRELLGLRRGDQDQVPRRRRAPSSGLGPRRAARMGLDVRRRVHRPDPAAGRRPRHPRCRAGAPGRGHRPGGVDRRHAVGVRSAGGEPSPSNRVWW